MSVSSAPFDGRGSSPTQGRGRGAVGRDAAAEAELRELRHVRTLFLGSRGLTSIRHIQHLESMTGLRSLSLHMNHVRRVEGLAPLRNLVELDLSGNEVATLEAGCFRAQVHLSRLNLSSNFLTALPEGVFATLPSLAWLSLAFNQLTEVRAGLASIPRTAPLAYVDLGGNNIARLEDVVAGLEAHRLTLTELRLQTPQALLAAGHPSATSTTATGGGGGDWGVDGGGNGGALCVFNTAMSTTLLRENPLCRVTYPSTDGTQRQCSYVEEALRYFPRLKTINGVEFGIDPLAVTRQQQQQQKQQQQQQQHEKEQQQPMLPARKLTFSELGGQSPASAEKSRSVHFLSPEADTASSSSEEEDEAADRNSRNRRGARAPTHSTQDGTPLVTGRGRHGVGRERNAVAPRSRQARGAAAETTRSGAPTARARPSSAPSRDNGGGRRPAATATGTDAVSPSRQDRATSPAIAAEPPVTPARSSSNNSTTTTNNSRRLHWRPKRVTRGTNTDDSALEENSALSLPTSPETDRELERERQQHLEQLQQLHQQRQAALEEELRRAWQQLQARAAVEGELRGEVERMGQALAAAEREKKGQRVQFEQRVSALKDELVRRADEVVVMRRKERASLEQQAGDIERYWRDAMAGQEEEWREAARAEVRSVTEDRDRQLAQAQQHVASLEEELASRRAECTRAQEQLRTAGAREDHWRAVVDFCAAEADLRRSLEREASQVCLDAYAALSAATRAEKEGLVEEWEQYQETWQTYAASLQAHYRDVLDHASREAASLQQQVDALKALHTPPSPGARRAGSRDDTGEAAASAESSEGSKETTRVAAVRHDAAAQTEEAAGRGRDDDAAATAAVVVHPSGLQLTPTAAGDSAASAADPLLAATDYWRAVAARRQEEVARLRGALDISEQSHSTVAAENGRLLAKLRALEAQAAEGSGTSAEEKESLLRGLRNLQDSIAKKDAALDALEEEARQKLDEKRGVIAGLQEELEAAREARAGVTASNVKLKDELEELRQRLDSAQATVAAHERALSEKERAVATLTTAVETLRDKAGGRAEERDGQQRQREVEVARLIAALTVAREQLARVHESHTHLSRENARLAAALESREREAAEAKQQLKEQQELGRVKQRATLEALTKMMVLSDGS